MSVKPFIVFFDGGTGAAPGSDTHPGRSLVVSPILTGPWEAGRLIRQGTGRGPSDLRSDGPSFITILREAERLPGPGSCPAPGWTRFAVIRRSPSQESSSWARSGDRQLVLFRVGVPTKLGFGAGFDLADAFLGDPQLLADPPQRLLVGSADPVAAGDDSPLAIVEPTEQSLDLTLTLLMSLLLIVLVGTGVSGGLKHLLVASEEADAVV